MRVRVRVRMRVRVRVSVRVRVRVSVSVRVRVSMMATLYTRRPPEWESSLHSDRVAWLGLG